MSSEEAVLDKEYKIISEVDTQKVKSDYVDGVFQSKSATGGPNKNKNDDSDDEEEQPVLEDLLNDNNLIMNTFSKAQKVMAKANPSDTVGVGKTKIVIPDFMKTYS